MRMAEGGLVFKLLFSAAKPGDFPEDILQGSVVTSVLPNAGGQPIPVRLLQIDIAVKDNRAAPTGWYFATYAYDRSAAARARRGGACAGWPHVGKRSEWRAAHASPGSIRRPGVRAQSPGH